MPSIVARSIPRQQALCCGRTLNICETPTDGKGLAPCIFSCPIPICPVHQQDVQVYCSELCFITTHAQQMSTHPPAAPHATSTPANHAPSAAAVGRRLCLCCCSPLVFCHSRPFTRSRRQVHLGQDVGAGHVRQGEAGRASGHGREASAQGDGQGQDQGERDGRADQEGDQHHADAATRQHHSAHRGAGQ